MISTKVKDIFIFVASCFLAVAAIAISRAGDEIVELAQKLELAMKAREASCVCEPCESLVQIEDCSDEIQVYRELAEGCVDSKMRTPNKVR